MTSNTTAGSNRVVVKRKYDRRTLNALIRHLTEQGGSTQTYLKTHPRVSQEQVDAIFVDLRDAVDRRAAGG